MAVNWDNNDPSDGDVAFPDVAGEIRQVYTDMQEILNSIFTDNTLPPLPATIANYDAQIPNVGVVPAPSRIRGDRVDLRGYPHRRIAAVTRALINTTSGGGGTFAAATGLQIIITPVSTSSLILIRLQCLAHVYNSAGTFSHAATTRYGAARIYNTTAAAAIGQPHWMPVGQGQSGGANAGTYYPITLIADTTGISGANTFDVEIATGDAQTTLDLHGDLVTTQLDCFEIL